MKNHELPVGIKAEGSDFLKIAAGIVQTADLSYKSPAEVVLL